MRDSEQEYPLHQPRRNRYRGPFDDENSPDFEEQPRPRPRRRPQRPLPEYDVSATPALPEGRLGKALVSGVIAGVLCTSQDLIIVLLNASKYYAYNQRYVPNEPNPFDFTIFGLFVLRTVISLLICLIAGFIEGNVVVQRRLGFLIGFIAGAIYFAVTFLEGYIPGYPDHLPYNGPVSAGALIGGIIFSLVLLIIYGAIGGLVSLLGTRIATHNHPYYKGEK